MKTVTLVVGLGLAVGLMGCTNAVQTPTTAPQGLYFQSPKQAVPVIADLLEKKDFATLAEYYDLSGTEVKRAGLLSGEFFIRTERPQGAHPAGFWRYKHPFAPAFEYHGESPASGKPGVYVVQVMVEIDQGEGAPVQRGFDEFLMRKGERGWQVLPGRPVQP